MEFSFGFYIVAAVSIWRVQVVRVISGAIRLTTDDALPFAGARGAESGFDLDSVTCSSEGGGYTTEAVRDGFHRASC